jgi:soluble P-type ATPase
MKCNPLDCRKAGDLGAAAPRGFSLRKPRRKAPASFTQREPGGESINMIEIQVPGRGTYRLEHLVLDVNGTIAVQGQLIAGVAPRLAELRRLLKVHMLTADTRGRQQAIDMQLEMEAVRIQPEDEVMQKAFFVQELGSETVCAIGNGANDAGMLRTAQLAIAVLGEEGLAVETLSAAAVVVPHVNTALDLLLNPLRLVATLRH